MVLLFGSATLAPAPAATNGGGSPAGTYYTPAFELGAGDSDTIVALRVTPGAITGTTPSVKATVQTMKIVEDSSSGTWTDVYTTPSVASAGNFFDILPNAVLGKCRIKLVYGNGDNVCAAPYVELDANVPINADSNP